MRVHVVLDATSWRVIKWCEASEEGKKWRRRVQEKRQLETKDSEGKRIKEGKKRTSLRSGGKIRVHMFIWTVLLKIDNITYENIDRLFLPSRSVANM